jgi:hypothetical protein
MDTICGKKVHYLGGDYILGNYVKPNVLITVKFQYSAVIKI